MSSPPSKRQKLAATNPPIPVYIIQNKIHSEQISALYSIIERSQHSSNGPAFRLVPDPDTADVIITVFKMRKRLERHISWDIAQRKAIVTPEWLQTSIETNRLASCADFASLHELHDETAENCPCYDCESQIHKQSSASAFHLSDANETVSVDHAEYDYRASYSCQRASPLFCVNQPLIAQLAIIRRSRELEGEQISARSYAKAIAVIKSFPSEIEDTNINQVRNLPHIGPKTLSKIEEYIETGEISEAVLIRDSERYCSLVDFTAVYGIGPSTGRDLFARGCRTVQDLKDYYGSKSQAHVSKPSQRLSEVPQLSMMEALEIVEDISQTISREEVEKIHKLVQQVLEPILEGCHSVICGGYRRGKSESNDVDITITHPKLEPGGNGVKDLSTRLVRALHNQGLVTHVMHLSGFHSPNALRNSNWDSLEKALTVFTPPRDKNERRIHRRVDLIFAAPSAFWTAVVGWTGSTTFERDLRHWAKEKKGYKFDSSGITRRHDSRQFFPNSEKDVFELLGLKWIDPTLRNADF